jgi:hypothetical protein
MAIGEDAWTQEESGTAPAVVERFLLALRRRDFDGIEGCFSDTALLRAVVPPGVREDVGPREIADRYRLWLGEEGDYAVHDAESSPFAGLTRIRYVVEHVDPEDGRLVFEQTAYVDVEDDRLVAMRVACSGNRPLST